MNSENKVLNKRLPTLYEVLNQQTTVPVDLWSFYTYLSQFPHAANYLDFWIDIMAHFVLCRDYVKEVRESVLLWDDRRELQSKTIQENRDSISSSILLEALLNDGFLDFQDNKRVSQFLKGDAESLKASQLLDILKRREVNTIINEEGFRLKKNRLSEVLDEFLHNRVKKDTRPTIDTKQLIASANNLINQYILSPEQSPRYLTNLPDRVRKNTIHMVHVEKRHDPDVFENLKSLAFQFMETDCFPKFLSSIALHNLHDDITYKVDSQYSANSRSSLKIYPRTHRVSPFSRWTTLSRVAFGFLFLCIGFWIGYTLIFLDYNRKIRVVTLVPFLLGSYYIVCGIYCLDIIYAFAGVTQALITEKSLTDYEPGYTKRLAIESTSKENVPFYLIIMGGKNRLIKVDHLFILKLMRRRAWWCVFLVIAMTTIFTVIFSCVPGHRI